MLEPLPSVSLPQPFTTARHCVGASTVIAGIVQLGVMYVRAMPLTTGINHVALVTADLDRFVGFYTSVFEATVFAELTEGPVRHALVDLGGGVALHPFEFAGRPADGPFGEMFQRGHLDHVSLNVADERTFGELRRRLVERGSSDGVMTDFGAVRTVAYRDPDGWWGEIAIWTGGDPVPLDEAVVSTADL